MTVTQHMNGLVVADNKWILCHHGLAIADNKRILKRHGLGVVDNKWILWRHGIAIAESINIYTVIVNKEQNTSLSTNYSYLN